MIEGLANIIDDLGDFLEAFFSLKPTKPDYKQKLEDGDFIQTTGETVGSLKTTKGNQLLIVEFNLADGTTVREKSKNAMKRNIEVGKSVQIAYNPKDLKEIYLLD